MTNLRLIGSIVLLSFLLFGCVAISETQQNLDYMDIQQTTIYDSYYNLER